MINKNSFSLYKSALLWLVVIVLSVTTGAGSVYASAPAPTVGDIVKSAENYLKGTVSDFPSKLRAAFWLKVHKKPALYQELKGKLIALRSQDGTSNTLAHKIVSDIAQGVEGVGLRILGYLFSIEGIRVLETKNQNDQLPLSALSTNDKLPMLFDLNEYASQDEGLFREFYDYLKAHELVPLKRHVSGLVEEIDSLILDFPNEIEISRSDKSRDLANKKRALEEIIELCPSAFEGQKLENFSDLFKAFNRTPEGRDILREYRTGGGKSLLQYCGEMFLNQEGHGYEFERRGNETILLTYTSRS